MLILLLPTDARLIARRDGLVSPRHLCQAVLACTACTNFVCESSYERRPRSAQHGFQLERHVSRRSSAKSQFSRPSTDCRCRRHLCRQHDDGLTVRPRSSHVRPCWPYRESQHHRRCRRCCHHPRCSQHDDGFTVKLRCSHVRPCWPYRESYICSHRVVWTARFVCPCPSVSYAHVWTLILHTILCACPLFCSTGASTLFDLRRRVTAEIAAFHHGAWRSPRCGLVWTSRKYSCSSGQQMCSWIDNVVSLT